MNIGVIIEVDDRLTMKESKEIAEKVVAYAAKLNAAALNEDFNNDGDFSFLTKETIQTPVQTEIDFK